MEKLSEVVKVVMNSTPELMNNQFVKLPERVVRRKGKEIHFEQRTSAQFYP